MNLISRSLLVLVLASSALASHAQLPLLDITLVTTSPTELEVRVRPDGDFTELFSSLVFTVRWSTASGAQLDDPVQVPPAANYMPIGQSGPETDDGGYRYQIYAGLGFSQVGAGGGWLAGQEYVIATLPVIGGPDVFEIVNDAWTAANNGDFYVSLNGQEQQGVIYSSNTGINTGVAEAGLTIRPNPTQGATELVYVAPVPSDVNLVIVNSAGQEVWHRERKAVSGTWRETVDLSRFGKGAYVLTLTDGSGTSTRKILVQ